MSAQVVLLPDAVGMRHDRGVAPYLWSDLIARRNALGLQLDDVAELLGVDWDRYVRRENGNKKINAPSLVNELTEMEAFVTEATDAMIASAQDSDGEQIVLQAFTDQAAFSNSYPEERTLGSRNPYPVLLHDVAVGRAAAALTRVGHDVAVLRGERRADLAVRRLAVGLTKNEAGPFLGIREKKYYPIENGAKPPAAGLIAEFQAVDDFIARLVDETDVAVAEVDGVTVVAMFDDEADFIEQYPNAQTLRDGRQYPLRVCQVAAGRLAGSLDAAGEEVRIVASTADPGRRFNRGADYAVDRRRL